MRWTRSFFINAGAFYRILKLFTEQQNRGQHSRTLIYILQAQVILCVMELAPVLSIVTLEQLDNISVKVEYLY